MKIVILTTEGHMYANYLLKHLLFKYFPDDDFYVFESDKLLAGHNTSFGALIKYIQVSGLYYVINQIIKVYTVKIIWQIGKIIKVKNISSSLVYWKSLKTNKKNSFIVSNIKSSDTIEQISSIKPDVIISLLFNQIISESVYSLAKYGTFNLHPAMLPKYKGVSPTFWVLSEDAIESGVTIHRVVKKIDEGELVSQRKVKIRSGDSEHSLYARCTVVANDMIRNLLNDIKAAKELSVIKTDRDGFYRSLPSKQAVGEFRKNKRKFFRFSELFTSFEKL